MAVERLDPAQVGEHAVDALGLDSHSFDVVSIEVLAASVRRAASFLCPTTPGALVRAVSEALSGLPGFDDERRSEVATVLESLVSYGDLIELPLDGDQGRRRHIFLGSPGYVERNDRCVLVGVRPEGAPLVGEALRTRVEHVRHVRFVPAESSSSLPEDLAAEGLRPLRHEQWLEVPRPSSAQGFVDSYVDRLKAAGPAGDIEELTILDPTSSVTYYRARWRPLEPRDEGRFVARRAQAFGAPLWCFAEVAEGAAASLVDLPVYAPLSPGADEGLRLQAAIDAVAGQPQKVRVAAGATPRLRTLDLFSPVPSWVQRRLDVIGRPTDRSGGALFSYKLSEADVAEEVEFLENMMWLSSEVQAEGTPGGH